jgi:Fe(3+) dicitrate transport protein
MPRTSVRLSLVLGVLLFGGFAPAKAQEVPDTVIVLQPVHVRVIVADDPVHTPGAASLLTKGEMERLRPPTLHEALSLVPGVRTIDDDVLGLRSGIGIRGAPPRRSRKTLLLEDGSPINGSTYLDPGAHYTPPTERLERVEVLKGAGQIVHGPLNNHGIINFRNRRPGAVPETRLEVGGGEASTFRRHALHSRRVGSVGMLLSYTGMNADGTFDVERHQFDDFYGSLVWAQGDRHAVHSSLTYFRERSTGYDEGNLSPAQFAAHPRSKLILGQGREFNNISVDYLKADLSYDARLTERLTLSSKVFATEKDRPRFQTRGIAPDAAGEMEGRARLYETAGAEVRLQFSDVRFAGTRQTMQAGLRHERHRFEDGRPVGRPGEVLNHGNRGNLFARSGVDGYRRNGRLVTFRAPATSAFVQTAIRNGNFTFSPGVRLERYRQTRKIDFWPGNPAEGTEQSEAHTLLLPGVSALFHGSARTQVYGGVHRGYAPATARSEEFPLVPEIGVNSQLGVRTAVRPWLALDAAAFFNRIQNTLIRDDVDVLGDALFVNAADSRVYGFDLGGRASTGVLREGTLDLFSEVAYNYTRAEFVEFPLRGNRVPEVPLHVGTLTGGLQRAGGWHLSGTVTHFGQFFADKENSPGLREDGGEVPARTLLGARVSYTVGGPAGPSLWLQGRNLTDRLYVSDVQDGLRPGAPRTIVAGVTYAF